MSRCWTPAAPKASPGAPVVDGRADIPSHHRPFRGCSPPPKPGPPACCLVLPGEPNAGRACGWRRSQRPAFGRGWKAGGPEATEAPRDGSSSTSRAMATRSAWQWTRSAGGCRRWEPPPHLAHEPSPHARALLAAVAQNPERPLENVGRGPLTPTIVERLTSLPFEMM